MARWFPSRRRTPEQDPDLGKAAATGGQTFSAAQVAAMLQAVSVAPQVGGAMTPLPRTDPRVAFGPGVPLIPDAIDPLRPDTHRPEPRFNEYPVSSNLPGVTDRLVPWKVLRDAAEQGGIPRRCIEIRKNEVATLDWAITISKGAVAAAQAGHPSMARADVEADLRKRLGSEIARCSTFWEKPDPGQDEDTIEWLSKLLEDHFVLDAVAIYPRLTFSGGLYALEILDGATIKVLRDWRGGRPQPPQPAFQQLLWGFPRGEFIADVDEDGQVINGYRPDQLIYKRRNVRSTTPYGYSAVEQALGDIDVWLRRHQWIRAEYTDGTLPVGWLKASADTAWTPQQTLEYERMLNDTYAGQTLERHRLRILPPGFETEMLGEIAEKYRPDYDLYLLKLVASHFDTTIAELGFTEPGGLGSTGYHEGQADVQQRKATLPTLRWLQKLITSISRAHLGMPVELEFKFLGLEEEDEAAADAVADARVSSGRMTYNEDRDRMGLPRYPFPEADMPIVKTQRGVIFLEGASQLAPPGDLIEPPQAPKNTGNSANSDGEQEPAQQPSRGEAVKTELAAFNRWARRNPSPRRPFTFETVTKADAPDLIGDARVVFAEPGGGVSPKAGERPDRRWPGWERDEGTADAWAPRIAKAMTGAVDTRGLAERWLAEQLVKADHTDTTVVDVGDYWTTPDQDPDSDSDRWAVAAALAFLQRHHITLVPAVAFLRLVWLEGWAIGHHAAEALLQDSDAAWEWAEGDAEAAARTLPESVRAAAEGWLNHATAWVQSIAASRLTALAKVLSTGGRAGATAGKLAGLLHSVLADRAWAQMAALTELTRASSAAATVTYQQAGAAQLCWNTEEDARVCQECLDNEAYGPVPAGGTWPDGCDGPPAHPRCRCWLSPN